jgi:hypothetical protein
VAQLLSQAWSLGGKVFNLCILVDRLLELFLSKQNVTSLKVSFCILFVKFDSSSEIFKRLFILADLMQRTGPVVKNCLVKSCVELVELETLFIQVDSLLFLLQLISLVGLLFELLHLVEALPELDEDFVVRVNVQCLFQVFLSHVGLPVVKKDSAAPKQKFRVIDEAVLELGGESDGASHVVGALGDYRFNLPCVVFHGVSCVLEDFAEVKSGLTELSFLFGCESEAFIFDQLVDELNFWLCS